MNELEKLKEELKTAKAEAGKDTDNSNFTLQNIIDIQDKIINELEK